MGLRALFVIASRWSGVMGPSFQAIAALRLMDTVEHFPCQPYALPDNPQPYLKGYSSHNPGRSPAPKQAFQKARAFTPPLRPPKRKGHVRPAGKFF